MIRLEENLPFDEKVIIFNEITSELYHWIGIDCPALNVHLVPVDEVAGNDYNPNVVAPPEMKLLRLSIKRDGVTMPVVVCRENDTYTVVDGFHRTKVCRDDKEVRDKLHGYLPVSFLNKSRSERITATVRHNMARGSHKVELSAHIAALLKDDNYTDAQISKELGMDADEVLRLKQITGLAEAFKDEEFSKSWT